MGSRHVKYEFSPKENEQIEAVIKVQDETRSAIHGVVVDCRNKPIRNAVVKLMEVIPGNPSRMKPLTHAFTDEAGQFLFGPLYCNRRYALKIWYSDVKIRELIISPDCDGRCDDEYIEDYHDDRHSDDDYSEDGQSNEDFDNEYRDGHYEGHCDISIDNCFGGSDDEDEEEFVEMKNIDNGSDSHKDDYVKRRNRKVNDNRRDRHSDDDQRIQYRAPKVYGQKCSKCEIKNKINSFADAEK